MDLPILSLFVCVCVLRVCLCLLSFRAKLAAFVGSFVRQQTLEAKHHNMYIENKERQMLQPVNVLFTIAKASWTWWWRRRRRGRRRLWWRPFARSRNYISAQRKIEGKVGKEATSRTTKMMMARVSGRRYGIHHYFSCWAVYMVIRSQLESFTKKQNPNKKKEKWIEIVRNFCTKHYIIHFAPYSVCVISCKFETYVYVIHEARASTCRFSFFLVFAFVCAFGASERRASE